MLPSRLHRNPPPHGLQHTPRLQTPTPTASVPTAPTAPTLRHQPQHRPPHGAPAGAPPRRARTAFPTTRRTMDTTAPTVSTHPRLQRTPRSHGLQRTPRSHGPQRTPRSQNASLRSREHLAPRWLYYFVCWTLWMATSTSHPRRCSALRSFLAFPPTQSGHLLVDASWQSSTKGERLTSHKDPAIPTVP